MPDLILVDLCPTCWDPCCDGHCDEEQALCSDLRYGEHTRSLPDFSTRQDGNTEYDHHCRDGGPSPLGHG